MALLSVLTLCVILQRVNTAVECLNCEGVEVLQCRSTCTGNSCYISVKNDLSLQFGCSNELEVDMCITTVSLGEVQSVSCYCSADSCNGPAALIKYFLVSRRTKRESSSASASITFGSNSPSAKEQSEDGPHGVPGGVASALSAHCICVNNATKCSCGNNSTNEATNETSTTPPGVQATMVTDVTVPVITTSPSQNINVVLPTSVISTEAAPSATMPGPANSTQQSSAAPGPVVNQSDAITAVVNSVLSRIEVIMDSFKNNSNPLVQSVLKDFENNQDKLKQQINKILASTV